MTGGGSAFFSFRLLIHKIVWLWLEQVLRSEETLETSLSTKQSQPFPVEGVRHRSRAAHLAVGLTGIDFGDVTGLGEGVAWLGPRDAARSSSSKGTLQTVFQFE